MSRSEEELTQEHIAVLTAEAMAAGEEKRKAIDEDIARVQASRQVSEKEASAFLIDTETAKPCYFNAGSCTGEDGSITGIEIADGEVRGVRWYQTPHDPKFEISFRRPLAEVFELCH